MAQYIDKSAVLAEIEKRISENKKDIERSFHKNLEDYFEGYEDALVLFKEKFLDTLEVKEDDLLTEKKNEKVLAEIYVNTFDKKFGDKLPNLKGKQLADFKNFINTCEQAFHMKYFDIHATQGKLFEKLALLWAVWGKEHLNPEVKEVDLEKEFYDFLDVLIGKDNGHLSEDELFSIAEYFFELGLKAQKGE